MAAAVDVNRASALSLPTILGFVGEKFNSSKILSNASGLVLVGDDWLSLLMSVGRFAEIRNEAIIVSQSEKYFWENKRKSKKLCYYFLLQNVTFLFF